VQAQSQQMGPGGPAHRSVAAGRGVNWWTEAWPWMFGGGRAGVWIGMGLVVMVIYVVLHLVGALGAVVAHLLLFPLAGGLMLAARKSERGEALELADVFAGFRSHAAPLLLAGVLVIAASLVVVGLMSVVGVGAALSAFLGGLAVDLGSHPEAAAGLGITAALLLVVCLALFIPISMAAWLAPALIVLRAAGRCAQAEPRCVPRQHRCAGGIRPVVHRLRGAGIDLPWPGLARADADGGAFNVWRLQGPPRAHGRHPPLAAPRRPGAADRVD
jgi:hypothetical protein